MKKVLSICLLTLFLGVFSVAQAQEQQDTTSIGKSIKKGAKKTGHFVKKSGKAVGKGAKKVGRKTAQLASKAESGVVDKVYEDKVAPNGSKVYINKNARYYWIDKKGKRHYINEAALKDKES